MGRVSTREQRVRLFQRGNDRCPICLTCFTEEGIEAGKEVTLEHVPPRSFALGGLAMCLTCAECNNRASRAEQVAAAVIKGREKVRVDVPGLPPLSAYVPQREENGVWQLITPHRTDIPRNFFEAGWREANRTGLTIHGWTTPHYKDVPWLKAAYLAVFSLLGVYGYRYAKGAATAEIRRQIREPERMITSVCKSDIVSWEGPSGIAVSDQIPGWVVRMGNRIILLPAGWDTTFSEWFAARREKPTIVEKASVWPLCKFGADSGAGSFAFREGFHALEMLGEDAFGKQGSVIQDGERTSFIVVDCYGQEVTVMSTETVTAGED